MGTDAGPTAAVYIAFPSIELPVIAGGVDTDALLADGALAVRLISTITTGAASCAEGTTAVLITLGTVCGLIFAVGRGTAIGLTAIIVHQVSVVTHLTRAYHAITAAWPLAIAVAPISLDEVGVVADFAIGQNAIAAPGMPAVW
jgi:hypothetical protein